MKMDYRLNRNEYESLDEVVGELNAYENNFITSKTEHKSQQRKIPKIVINASFNLLAGLIGGITLSALYAMVDANYNPTTSLYLSTGGIMFSTLLGGYVVIGDKSADALISASCATLGTLLGMYLQRM